MSITGKTAVLAAAGLLAALPPAASAADDLEALFDAKYEGIALNLSEPDEVLAARPRATDFGPMALPGFSLTDEELSLVLRVVDPLGPANEAPGTGARAPSIRQGFVEWIRNASRGANKASVFSALAREADEPGVRVDIDPDAEEVRVEYRVGF